MERGGPSIEIKLVTLVAGVLVVHDAVLLLMYLNGTSPNIIQIVLGAVILPALIIVAVWGNALGRAIRRLSWVCRAAKEGDTNLLTVLPRTDEVGQLNDDINSLVVELRRLGETERTLGSSRQLVDTIVRTAPELLRASQEVLVSMKELKEGAGAETSILRRASRNMTEAGGLLGRLTVTGSGSPGEGIAAKLKALGGLRREIELLSDMIMDEVARPQIDAAALARAVNGLRDASRILADVAEQAAPALEAKLTDIRVAVAATGYMETADEERQDGARIAELMQRSAGSGISAATRLASALHQLGVVLEAYEAQRRLEDRR
jgi:HAMP domain-containing protein